MGTIVLAHKERRRKDRTPENSLTNAAHLCTLPGFEQIIVSIWATPLAVTVFGTSNRTVCSICITRVLSYQTLS